MNIQIVLPADDETVKGFVDAGFTDEEAVAVAGKFAHLEYSMQNEVNTRHNEVLTEISELRSEMKAVVEKMDAGFMVMGTMISELRSGIKELRSEVRSDIKELRSEVRSDIKELRSEVRFDIKELRSEVKAEMATKTEVAAAVSEAGKDRMTQLISWGLAVGLAALAFIGGTFIP